MSSIGGVAYGNSPWTGLQRLQPPSREDLLQNAQARSRAGADAAELRQMLATRVGGPVAAQAAPAREPAANAGRAVAESAGEDRAAAPMDAATVDSALNALAQPQAGSTLEFALRRSEDPSALRPQGAAAAAGGGAAESQRSPQALLQAADGNGDQQLSPAEAATPNGALTRVLSPATTTTPRAPESAAERAPSSPSSPRPVQQGGLDAQAERLAQWMQQQYAAGCGGAMAATGSQVNTSA